MKPIKKSLGWCLPILLCAAGIGGCATKGSNSGMSSQSSETGKKAAPAEMPQVAVKPAPVRTAADEKAHFRARLQEYWTARVDKDWPTIYQYEPPAGREKTSETQFVILCEEKGVFRFSSFTLHDVEMDGDMGWADIESECTLREFPAIPSQKIRNWDKWHRVDGEWYPVSPNETDTIPSLPRERDLGEELVLRHRLAEFCDARTSGDLERLFTFVPPEIREGMGLNTFVAGERIFRILSCDLKWVEVIGEAGRVRVEYLLTPGDPSLSKLPPSKVLVTEKWRKIDGVWYRTTKADLGCGKKS